MQYRKFGRTGLTVSSLCLGTGTFGTQTDEAEARRILDAAADGGITFLDTADIYPPGGTGFEVVGRSEEITGRWLKGRRGSVVVGSKAGGAMGPAAWDKGASRKHLLDAIEATLRRLDTDYVDLYQIHMDDPETPLDEMAEAMDAIVRAGKARYIGVSNFLAYRLARALGRQEVLRLTRFASVQPRYNLLFREIERELLPLAREEGIAVTPYNPLAGGLLTGKYRLDDNPDKGRFSGEFGQFGAMYKARYWQRREFETIAAIEGIARKGDMTLPTLAVAWILANPAVSSVILGASRASQLGPTLAAAGHDLPPALKAELDEITADYRRGDVGR